MTREILFRGKVKENKTWVFGSHVFARSRDYIIPWDWSNEKGGHDDRFICHPAQDQDGFVEVIPETVGQYTGLKDITRWNELTEGEREQWTRSGKMPSEWTGMKIFEGDRVQVYHPNHGLVNSKITFRNTQFCVNSGVMFYELRIFDIKIFGNMTDNQEDKNET